MLNFFTNGWRRSVRLDDAHLFPQTRESWPGRVLGGVRHPDLPDEFHQWGADDEPPPMALAAT